QEFKRLINNYFNNEKTILLDIFYFNIKKNYNTQQDKDIHIQGCFILYNQMLIGSYLNIEDKKDEKVLKKIEHFEIKKLLKIQKIHFDEANADFDYSISYCKKKYNRCFKYHNQPNSNDSENKIMRCRYDFQKLNDFSKCNWYDIDCCSKRTLARYDNESGFFEYRTYKTSSKNSEEKNQHQSLKNKRYLIIDEEILAIGIMNNLIDGKISGDEVTVNYAKDQLRWVVNNGSANISAISKVVKNNSRVGKGYLLSVLFPNVYKRRNNGGRFWQGFTSSHKEVLVNEFKGQEKYLETLNLLDCKEYSVQIKGSDINFCLFVIAYTANTSIQFIYDFCEDEHLKPKSEQNNNNTKLFSSDIEDFFKFKFEIKFNYDVMLEKAKKIVKGRYRTIEKLDNILYYHDEYLVDKSKYILGPIKLYYSDLYIPDSRIYVADRARRRLKENPLGHKHGIPSLVVEFPEIIQKLKNKYERKERNILFQRLRKDKTTEILQSNNIQIKSSSKRKYIEILDSSNFETEELKIQDSEINADLEYNYDSDIYSTDSDYTRTIKKRKFKAVDNLEIDIKQAAIQSNNEKLEIDIEQVIIQSNHEELNKNNIEQNIITNEEMQEEIELDIADEEIYQEFNRKNRNNPEFKHMK
ncbi:3824_t:CDS:2, partial [Scutellospora calospora]